MGWIWHHHLKPCPMYSQTLHLPTIVPVVTFGDQRCAFNPAFAKSLIESHKSNKAFDRCKQIKSTQAISSDIQTKQIFCQQSQSRYWPRHWLSTLAKAQFHHYLHKEQILEPIVNCRSENWKLAASSIDSLYRVLTALTAFASCWQLSQAVNSRSWSFNKLGNIGQTLTCVV